MGSGEGPALDPPGNSNIHRTPEQNSGSMHETFGFVMKDFGKYITLEFDTHTSVHLNR